MYDVFIDGLKMPVTPEKITTKIKGNNKVITLINESEINLLKEAGLTEVSFSLLIPAVQYSFANSFQEPKVYFDKFEDLKVNKKRFQFIVTRLKADGFPQFNTNLKMALEDYKITEDSKDGFDFIVDIDLKQAPDYGTKTLNIPTPQSPIEQATVTEPRNADTAPNKQPDYQLYTVVKGDSLWAIAKKMLGNGNRWKEIYELNKDQIKNPNLIYPMQILRLP